MSLNDGDPSAATDHHRKVETFSPSVLDLSLNVLQGRGFMNSNRSSLQSRYSFSFGSQPVPKCLWRTHICLRQQIIMVKYKQFLLPFSTCPSICLKDAHWLAATDHHRKVERVSPYIFDLSINCLKGQRWISSNSLSSQSRNSVLFCSGSIPAYPRTIWISFQQQILIANKKRTASGAINIAETSPYNHKLQNKFTIPLLLSKYTFLMDQHIIMDIFL